MSKTEELMAEAMTLAGDMEASFIRLGQVLRQLQDLDPIAYGAAVRDCGLASQVASDLVRINRAFANLPIPAARMRRIGWIKLAAVAPYIGRENYPVLLKQAEANDEAALDAILRGEAPAGVHSPVVFQLRDDERDTLNAALLNFGAIRSAEGMTNSEAALMLMAWFVQQQLEGFPIKDDDGDEKIGFINDDVEAVWVDAKVTATLEDRLDRVIRVLAKVRAERDSLRQQVDDLAGQFARGQVKSSDVPSAPDLAAASHAERIARKTDGQGQEAD